MTTYDEVPSRVSMECEVALGVAEDVGNIGEGGCDGMKIHREGYRRRKVYKRSDHGQERNSICERSTYS